LGRLRGSISAARIVDASNRIDVSYSVEDRIEGLIEYDISPAARGEAGLSLRKREFEGAIQPGLGITEEETRSVFAALTVDATAKVRLRLTAEYETLTRTIRCSITTAFNWV
jgi:hypothetical protein